MYDEMIKRLRTCANLGDCMDCQYRKPDNRFCLDNMLKEAADAIEELNRFKEECDGCGDKARGVIEKLQKMIPHWIPATERLPEVFKLVLVNIPGMLPHPTVQEAFREKNGMWYSNGFRYGADEITHWMPLPEPPKEE